MKQLVLFFFLLCALGIRSQEIALVDTNDMAIDILKKSKDSTKDTVYSDKLEHLGRRKLQQYLRKKGVTTKLIERGNEYFDKMWYAEAARIYDIVLEQSDVPHTYQLLSKAGDSHYYSGNMEKSYKWYHQLYELYKTEISADKFFRYAHVLKGTGRYRRAAKLTELFNGANQGAFGEREEINTWKGPALVEIKNMAINSQYSDFSPMFHKDSSVVYASAKDSSFITTRKYRWTNQPFLDLYVARANEESEQLTHPKKFSKNINTKYHEASVAFSPDQKTIYFTRNNYKKKLKRGKNGINHLKIYRSRYIDGAWEEAVEVPFNSEDYSTGHPSISPDGKKLYFVSDRPGGYGQTDIYMVDVLEDGQFSEPENLGRTVNTDKKEMFPYITDNALYFSSDRNMGMGGLDIYKADHVDGIFGVGINLGEPINSNRDDFSYIVDARGEKGYFASNRKGGKGDDDIYSFKYLENLNAISGHVSDEKTGDTIPDALVQLFNKDQVQIAEVRTSKDGSFKFEKLKPRTGYVVKTFKKGYFDAVQNVDTQNNINVEISPSLMPLKEIIKEDKGVLKLETETIYFDFDRFYIKPEAAKELNKLVAVMREYEDIVIKIESHTDAIGRKTYNKYLSDKRAKSTRDYIIAQGIDPSRIQSAIGYGEERLLNDCSDGIRCGRSQHQENRRSEFIIVSQ
ncbi:OmpA family protein [Muricauda sp. JGD-17]|uniref:OmpA family protein n=1 Tax=Flagellimonas ochracea TaxID=2696472 RepID=A0A964TCD2_9FLAO|nr:OmpA family protein [Allomuricauda ochracea]NAY91664.1 OmpA family protein [Allomuricauda ochracea]